MSGGCDFKETCPAASKNQTPFPALKVIHLPMTEGSRDGELVHFSYYGMNWRATHICATGSSTNKRVTIRLSLQPWSHLKPKIKSHSIASRKETMLPSKTDFTLWASHSSVTCYVMVVFSYYQ